MGQTAQVKIQLDSEAKLQALEQYNRRTKEAAERTANLRESLSTLSDMTKFGLVFGAAGLTVGALAEKCMEAKSAASVLASEIARSAGRVGVSAEAYQVFGMILKGAGGDAGDLVAALARLRAALGEAIQNDDSGPAKALRELNLSASDLSRLRPEVYFERVAKALTAVENPAIRAALAQDLLGKGAAAITPLIERLGTEGYGALRQEVEKTAGVMSGDMAKALDDVANRTENAGRRMAVALAPFQLKAAETKATIAELFAELANSRIAAGAGAAAAGGAVAAGVSAAAVTAGGLGPAAVWGALAGAYVAKAAAAAVPVWAGIGALIAVGFAGAAAIKGRLEQQPLAEQDLREAYLKAPLDRANALRDQLKEARDPAMVARIQEEAARRAREVSRRAAGEPDAEMRANLEESSKLYSGLVAIARSHGAEIVAANKALDEKNAKLQAEQQVAHELAVRDKEAYDWTEKQGKAMEAQTKTARRRLELSQLDAEQREIVLRMERENLVSGLQNFHGTDYEREKLRIETEAQLVTIDAELEQATKEIAANKEKAAKAAEQEAEAGERAQKALDRQLLHAQEAGVDYNLRDMAAQNARNQAAFGLTAEEKHRLNLAALEAERDYLATAAKDLWAEGSEESIQGARRYEDRSLEITKQLEAERAGTPENAMEGVAAGLTDIENRWGTLAQQMRTGIVSIGDAITGSLAGGMQQLLGTTEYWSRQLGTIAGPVMGAITQAISKMFAEWIVGRAAAAAKNIAAAAAETTAEAPAALFASIKSFGVAAALGIAGFLAAKALTGGFFEGGFTGLGNPRDVAGVVHNQEFVIPHDVTAAIGPGALSSLVESVRNPSQTFDVPAALSPQPLNVAMSSAREDSGGDEPWVQMPQVVLVDHRDQELVDRVLSNPRFKSKVIRIGRQNTGDFGSPT